MDRLLSRSIGLVLLITAVTTVTFSQRAWAYKVGDFTLTPVVTASERYDSNILSANTGEVDDFITEISLGGIVSLEGKNQNLSLQGAITEEIFAKEDQFTNTSENLLAKYRIDIDQSQTVKVSESFIHSQSPTTFSEQFDRTSGLYSYYLNRVGFDYTKMFSKEWSMTAGYQNEIYNRNLAGASDSVQHALNFRTDYAFSSETIVSGIYGYSVRQFDPGSDINSNVFDAALRQFFTKQLYADVSAGVSLIDVKDGDNYTKPRVKFVLTDELDEKTTSSFTILKQADASSDAADVFDYWRTSLDLNHDLYKRLNGRAEVFYGEGKYEGTDIKDKFTGTSLRLNYELTPSSIAFISNTFSDKTSNQSDRGYVKNVVMAGVNYKF